VLQGPGKDVDCYVSGTSRDMIGIWMGDIPLSKALKAGTVQLTGKRRLCRTFPKWFTLSTMAKTLRPASADRRS
jgi:hypothetical protein